VGASEIARNLFSGRRWVHWESAAGVVCLKEIWLDSDLVDHAICLQLGGHLSFPFPFSSPHDALIRSLSGLPSLRALRNNFR
jgi:hypothetical protein